MKTVAIAGRANVGKSTLFNKLTGKRTAIVADTPGVTRDRIYGECEWRGREFLLVDTGGIEPAGAGDMYKMMRVQAQIAIERADVIIFVTDLRSGVTPADAEVAEMLRASGKPVVLCVSKCDSIGPPPPEFYEFYSLGMGDPIGVSGVHGHGTGDLLDEVVRLLGDYEPPPAPDEYIRVAVIGKPNCGKSSLVNRLIGEQRAIVSDAAGTTRDSTDTYLDSPEGKFILIDTAGLRRSSKVCDDIERYSVLRCRMAVERADVCIIMIDASEGITEQDTRIAGLAAESGKGCIIAVNKWDAVEKDSGTMREFRKRIETEFAFMQYAPSAFISALTGQRVGTLLALARSACEENRKRIPTGMLNEMLAEAAARVQPPTDKGRRLKIYYVTQAGIQPPTFVFFCNNKQLFHYSYQRYLENQIRERFGFSGTPVKIVIRERGEE